MKEMSLRRLGVDSLIYTLGGLSEKILGVILIPLYARLFSPEQYGIISLITVFTSFLTIFLMLGTEGAVSRFFTGSTDKLDRRLTASTILYFRLLFFPLSILLMIHFANRLSILIFRNEAYAEYLTVALLATLFTMFYIVFANMFKWMLQPKRYIVLSILLFLTNISTIIWIVVFLRRGIIGIYEANLISYALFAVIAFLLVKKNFSFRFSLRRLKELLSFGIPLIPAAVFFYLLGYSSRYFLARLANLEQVGLYSIGSKLAFILAFIMFGFQIAWRPFVFSTFSKENAAKIYSRVFDYFSVFSLFIIVGLSLFSRELLMLFATSAYIKAYRVVPFIVAGLGVYIASDYIFCIGTEIAKKTIHRAWIGFSALAVNVILNFILIPPYGIIGAGLSALISFVLYAYLLVKVSQRYYFINYNFFPNFKLYLVAAFIIAIGCYLLNQGINFWLIAVKFCLWATVLASALAFKIIGAKELNSIKAWLFGRTEGAGV